MISIRFSAMLVLAVIVGGLGVFQVPLWAMLSILALCAAVIYYTIRGIRRELERINRYELTDHLPSDFEEYDDLE